jgi:ectoine hydroxylase
MKQLVDQSLVDEYQSKGYITVKGLFSAKEVEVLNQATSDVVQMDGPQVMRERNGLPHVIYGMHLMDKRLAALTRHPKIVAIAEQLLGDKIYVHQSRVNAKQTGGAIVNWHQDFGTYHRVDGVPRPDGIMIAIFLNDVSDYNAPLMAVPGSHVEGVVSQASTLTEAEDRDRASKYRYDITMEKMSELIDQYGLEHIIGPAGSVVFMNMQVVHGSTVNITPLRRVILYLNVCTVDNQGTSFARPEYLAARDFSAIEPLPEDCLSSLAAA